MEHNHRLKIFGVAIAAALVISAWAAGVWLGRSANAAQQSPPVGFDDTPLLPGQKWRVHDIQRPHPPLVTPGSQPGGAPSDAIVLFDGKDLSRWQSRGRRTDDGKMLAAGWKVENGYLEVAPGSGHIVTKESFGDVQLHVEWAAPAAVRGASQDRGNSGIMFMMGKYEVQVLDSYENVTYADGQAAALYGQFPPLVNASRRPGEWQTYDIVFEAPRFEGGKLVKPAHVTVFHNGVLAHNRQQMSGPVRHREVGVYAPHPAEEPMLLQDHGHPVRFRNIWARRLTGRDDR